jgi:uncharacterized protein (TIGR01777 family)
MPEFAKRSHMPVSAEALFAWHARPGALERLLPPWQRARVVERTGTIRDGDRTVLELGPRPFAARWTALHRDCREGREFTDEQVSGPFRSWVHTHRFVPEGPAASWLEDSIRYELPAGAVGRALGEPLVRRMLARMFAWRHARTRADLERHVAVSARGPLRIAVSGASGLIGSSLVPFLTTGGHEVRRLVRGSKSGPGEVRWDPERGEIDAAALEGLDAVVHLSGEPVAARWTPERRARIEQSRVESTRLLATALARLARPPRVLVSASAIGFYGDRGDAWLDESSPAGAGFLADVCKTWEAAAEPARQAGIRVAHPRIGVVLAAAGGALAAQLPLFRLGLGGRVGSGRQFVSWIALDDAVGALHHLLFADSVAGPVNLTAPEPVTNAELARTLARVLHRPALLPVPGSALRALAGDMGQALLLDGVRVRAGALEASGFAFRTPTLEAALRAELGLALPG